VEIECLLPAPAAAAAQHAPLQIMMQQQGIIDGKVATTPASTGIAKQTAVLAGMTPNVQKISRGSPIENATTDKSVMKKKNKSKEKNTALQSPSIVVGKKKSPQSVPNVAAPVFPTAPSQPTASSLGALDDTLSESCFSVSSVVVTPLGVTIALEACFAAAACIAEEGIFTLMGASRLPRVRTTCGASKEKSGFFFWLVAI
jgi:hypothetical protein